MHRQGRGELVPFDPEIERTINKLRRERRVLAAHNRYLANMAKNLQQNPNMRDENCNTPNYTLVDMCRV